MAALEPSSPESPSFDFGFGFNDANFSDRVMRIEILPEPDCLEDGVPGKKLGRFGPLSNANAFLLQFMIGALRTDPFKMLYDLFSHDEVAKDDEPSSPGMESAGVEVRTLHINSLILAGKSPFFHKLFTNGMKESQQRLVTLQIHASEEEALMDMLNFMYSSKLSRTTPAVLLNVLVAADKFEVASCIRYCSQQLSSLPMTRESALFYLELPSNVVMFDTVQHLRDAAKKFLIDRFKYFTEYEEEILKLPLASLEAVLSSDDLQVSCEDEVYKFVLKWARRHYPKLEERREILSRYILRFVRFPLMSIRQLKKVRTCGEIESEVASKVVVDALLFKAESPHRQLSLAAEDATATASFRQFVERPYIRPPVLVVHNLESPREKAIIVYLNLKREECVKMFPSGQIRSRTFQLGEEAEFVLSACCKVNHQLDHRFGLFVRMEGKKTVGLKVQYTFSGWKKDYQSFTWAYGATERFVGGEVKGCSDIFKMSWHNFVADHSQYFINGVLHLKAELKFY